MGTGELEFVTISAVLWPSRNAPAALLDKLRAPTSDEETEVAGAAGAPTSLGQFEPPFVPIAAVKQALLIEGAWHRDRHGRTQQLKSGDARLERVLDLLAYQQEADARGDLGPMAEAASDFDSVGWPFQLLPAFFSLPQEGPREVRKESASKADDNNLRIIGALLEFIEGRFTEHRHPDYVNKTQLIALLTDKYIGVPGLGVRTLNEKFSKAHRLLDEA